MITIYALSGEDGVIRYIGQTKRPLKRRLYAHVYYASPPHKPLPAWLRSEAAMGTLKITPIVVVEDDKADAIERALIAEHRKVGDLLNVQDGGRPGRMVLALDCQKTTAP